MLTRDPEKSTTTDAFPIKADVRNIVAVVQRHALLELEYEKRRTGKAPGQATIEARSMLERWETRHQPS